MKKTLLLGTLLAVGCLLIGSTVGATLVLKPYEDVFLPRVYISGVHVGGMTSEEGARAVLADLEHRANQTVGFYYADQAYSLTLQQLISPQSCQEQSAQIWRVEQEKTFSSRIARFFTKQETAYELRINQDTVALEAMIQLWRKEIDRPARDAQIVFTGQNFRVEPAAEGRKVDVEATLAQLPVTVDQLAVRYPILVQVDAPDFTEDEIANMGEIASYVTQYNPAEISRTSNLRQAAAKINGHVMRPGEEFSFNGVVGIRESATGYQDAMVIVNGRYELGLGGGICQVSSTLYNAVLLADLAIVERHNHALAVAYVPVGRDATVVYGALDFRFRNTTGSAIYLAAQAENGRMSVGIFGDVSHKKPIVIANYIDTSIPFQEVQELDPNMAPGTTKIEHGGSNGYTSRTYRNYLGADGEVVRSEFLSQDSYRPLNKLILAGPPLAQDGNGETQVAPPLDPAADQESPPGTEEGAAQEADDSPAPLPLRGPDDPGYLYDEVIL
jgi:vancomycin resistance protein YoaR